MRNEQRGQALAGVLVVMTILFALAGAIIIATSVLLRQQGGPRNSHTDDFAAQNAAADAVAQVAGSTSRCTTTALAGFPRPNPPPPPALSISIPNAFSSAPTDLASTAYCTRMDGVSAALPSYLYTDLHWGAGACADQPLPASNKVWIFFDARWSTSAYLYVDGNAPIPNRCSATPPPTPPTNPCVPTPKPACVRCGEVIAPPPMSQVVQVALSCDLTGNSSQSQLWLHVWAPVGPGAAHSPSRVFTVDQDPQHGGSVYLIAAATNLGKPDYEEALLFVSTDKTTNRLLYEAALP